MNSFKRSMVALVSSVVLVTGAFAPALASAASSSDGKLKVYVDVDSRYSNSNSDSPSDFTVRVDGSDISKDSFRGSSSGTTVYVDGWYSVSVQNRSGYAPSYSSGCYGDISRNDTETCRITMTSSYDYNQYGYNNNYNYGYPNTQYVQYPQQTYYPQQNYSYYTQPCGCTQTQAVVVSKYIPTLPNTGFEPVNASTTLSLALAALVVALLFAFPYVRKNLIAFVR